MSAHTADYDFELPAELIARHPPARREDARMLVLHRAEQRIEHGRIGDFPGYLSAGDLAVFNDTKVIPARLLADDRRAELLLLEEVGDGIWRCMGKPGKRLRVGHELVIRGQAAVVQSVLENGERLVRFAPGFDPLAAGEIPLPPYLERAPDEVDRERYQTVFARAAGAVAAPTAGLHFTAEMLDQIRHAFVTLHVGAGTFRPVQTEDVREHAMHEERYELSAETARAVNEARRVFAIGTTTVRVLESCGAVEPGRRVRARAGGTDIFIYPPYAFRAVDALLTNFHLPRSTLLMLVSALAEREFILAAYAEAIRERYRFFSYGDCMLIL